jgi:hypothetical protein
MEDALLWCDAVEWLRREFLSLPPRMREETAAICRRIVAEKEGLHALVSAAGGEAACRTCGGQCCPSGKYHVSVADVMAYLALGKPLFLPVFDGAACPYLGEKGCLMEPGFRPFPCVTFTCELIQARLSEDDLHSASEREGVLRELGRALDTLLRGRVTTPLLHVWEKQRRISLGGKNGDGYR